MNYDEARDQILSVFLGAWDSTLAVLYENMTVPGGGDPTPPKADESWCRVILRHHASGQASLSGAFGRKLYDRLGRVTFEIYSPLGDGSKKGYELAQSVTDAYQKARGGCVWYRNISVAEIGPSGAFFLISVSADFTYTQAS